MFEINFHYQDSSKAETLLSLRKVKFVSNSVYYIISKSFKKAMKHFTQLTWYIHKTQLMWLMQGLFVLFARVGSGDPVRVLHLFHNEYTGYN